MRAFSKIAYTPSVRAAQTRYGSADANAPFDLDSDARNTVSEHERDFIPTVDMLFIATVGQNGWPYVQHRGGPKGFLKILDERTLGFADFSGNRQYITAGNVVNDNRVALILIDPATRRRLKVWGRARIVHEHDEPGLIARLEVPTYRARIERGYVIEVEAFDFNCSQHITQRYTEQEMEAFVSELREEIRRLKHASAQTVRPMSFGSGALELVVCGVRQLTPRVRTYELRSADGSELPAVQPGAHLQLPFVTAAGAADTRAYSIASDPARRAAYEVAVLRETNGHGGSVAVHRDYTLGTIIRCSTPVNTFKLHDDLRPAVLMAGGVGITPLKAMAHSLVARGAPFHLHYAAKSRREAAYLDVLQHELGSDHLSFYPSTEGKRMNVATVLQQAPQDAVFYACGPQPLLDELGHAAGELRIAPNRIQLERFVAVRAAAVNRSVTVELRRSRNKIVVHADVSILDALKKAGINVPSDCRVGTCGTCATKVLDGIPEHRDCALSVFEREHASLMCICVSRAASPTLVLDL